MLHYGMMMMMTLLWQSYTSLFLFISQILPITSSTPPSLSFSPSFSTDFLVQDFAVIMIVAAIMLVITHKLKQPMVIGYIIAGMIIGPYTPPFRLIHNVNSL